MLEIQQASWHYMQVTASESQKANNFVKRLWSNPTLSGLSPLQKEEQLQQFLVINESKLFPTLNSTSFFPHMSWKQIRQSLQKSLSEHANQELIPLMTTVVADKIDLSFVNQHNNVSTAQLINELSGLMTKLLHNNQSRRELASPVTCLHFGLLDKYMHKAFKRRKYINFEFCRPEKGNVDYGKIINSVRLALIIRPSVFMFGTANRDDAVNAIFFQISPSIAHQVSDKTSTFLPSFPRQLVDVAIESALAFQENPQMKSISRMVAIFSQRSRNMNMDLKVFKGAESSDKSWFSVARKNYKFYGFDLDMLVELHSIATDNGW